ncbi:MAG: phosphoribosylformylglycinamidine synthase subunit PurQ [Vampirovibrionia bacterium]
MHFSTIVFPGSNCDKDCEDAVLNYLQQDHSFIWHKDTKLPDTDCVILPGGFSYGDYLRAGAIAKTSPIMQEVKKFAKNGGLVLGICNGFQVLTEIGLLPGTLMQNKSLKFICKEVYLKVKNDKTAFTNSFYNDEIIDMPIAHMEGNYYIDHNGYNQLKENNQIILEYCDEKGNQEENANPNGSVYNIAGICNKAKNVLGLMPHPERNVDILLGSNTGLKLFESIEKHINKK